VVVSALPHLASPRPRPAVAEAAMVTASYAPDFERCRLLCETADRYVEGVAHHYILVEQRDVALFRQLESARRSVIDERELLPRWLRPFDDPFSMMRRRIWLSLRTKPLRGWHVQQLRRIAIASVATESTLVYCDSDVAFVRPFDMGVFRKDHRTRLFRRDGALRRPDLALHRTWSQNAAATLGIAAPDGAFHDYISTLIAWDRATALAMCAHVERVSGRHWVEAIGATRKYSECLIYGRYVDEVLNGADHFHGAEELCRVQWTGEPLSEKTFREFVDGLGEEQSAIGLQSFIGTDPAWMRRILTQA
jgi:hypothetical protein